MQTVSLIYLIILLSRSAPCVWNVYLGRETQAGPNVHEVNRTVSQIIIHPDYNDDTINNDIALIKLSSPVTFTDYIRPVCLASNSSQFHSSTPCWSTGWGKLGKDGEFSFVIMHMLLTLTVCSKHCCA